MSSQKDPAAPTTPPPPPSPTKCTACLDSLPPSIPHLLIDSSPLCHPCFRHLFILALSSETSFPASWASHPLSAHRYAHILGPTLLTAYLAKGTEYACPAQERVFCSRTDPPRRPEACGTFVGRWRETRTATALCVKCEQCSWYTCLRCEETFSTGDVAGSLAAISHECDPLRDGELEERAFEGLRRGREWQICPNSRCKRRVELSDGCNHMRCVCKAHFCFVCGDFVRDGEGHWKRDGGCPRFGMKGAERAIYDDEDVWDDNGDGLGDEERARVLQAREEEGGVEEEGLRRAFEVQMRIFEEVRRELEVAEARRLRDRERDVLGSGRVGEGDVDGQRSQRRRRRRRPHEGNNGSVDERRRRERRNARSRRVDSEVRRPAFDDSSVRAPRTRRGLRAFLSDAIDVTDYVLFGGSSKRRD